MNRLGTMLTAATTAVLLTGCGGSPTSSEDASSPSASPSEATPSESASPSGVPPNIGDNALQLGQPRKGLYVTTTVLEVRQGEAGPDYAQPDAGQEWAIVRAKQCVKDDSPESFPTSTINYVGLDDDGGEYEPSGTSWDGWPPTPTYPADRMLSPGQCASGWVLFQVAQGQRFTKVGLDGGDGALAAEWVI